MLVLKLIRGDIRVLIAAMKRPRKFGAGQPGCIVIFGGMDDITKLRVHLRWDL